MSRETRLNKIIGQPMSAVSFVQDYVEFHFDGKIFRALGSPAVCIGGSTITFPEPGSRDLLCAFIGKNVADVIVREDELIEIRFNDSGLIRVPLLEGSRIGPEAAHFVVPEEDVMEIW